MNKKELKKKALQKMSKEEFRLFESQLNGLSITIQRNGNRYGKEYAKYLREYTSKKIEAKTQIVIAQGLSYLVDGKRYAEIKKELKNNRN